MKELEKTTRMRLLIPVWVLLTLLFCAGAASILEFPTHQGAVYLVFAGITLLVGFLGPIPCIGFSAAGLTSAVKLRRSQGGMLRLIAAGILELVTESCWLLLAVSLFLLALGV